MWHAGWVPTPVAPDPLGDDPPATDGVTVVPEVESNPAMQLADPATATLEELVDAARAGSHPAFDELVRRTHAGTFTLARRLVTDEDDAREVVQEAYLRAYRSIRKFRGDAQFTTWIYRITANCASTHLGRRRRDRHDELDDDLTVVDLHPDRDPGLAADASLLRARVDAAIADLPARLRAVVVLRDLYDLNHAEIAEELGITESAAKVRLHRARRRLRTVVFPSRAEATCEEPEGRARAV